MLRVLAVLGLVAWLELFGPRPDAPRLAAALVEGPARPAIERPFAQGHAPAVPEAGLPLTGGRAQALADWLRTFWPLVLALLALPFVKRLGRYAPYAAMALAAAALGLPFLDHGLALAGHTLMAGVGAGLDLAGHTLHAAAHWAGQTLAPPVG